MDSILQQRRIRLWEAVCQHYSIPKTRFQMLDTAIRTGQDIPPIKKAGRPKQT